MVCILFGSWVNYFFNNKFDNVIKRRTFAFQNNEYPNAEVA